MYSGLAQAHPELTLNLGRREPSKTRYKRDVTKSQVLWHNTDRQVTRINSKSGAVIKQQRIFVVQETISNVKGHF